MVPRVSQSCRASPAFPDPISASKPISKSESHVHRNVRDGQKPWPPKSALRQRQTFPESQLLTRGVGSPPSFDALPKVHSITSWQRRAVSKC